MKCRKCATEFEGSFCPKCGEAVVRKCKRCGAILKDDDLFCGVCGASLTNIKKCVSCGAVLKDDDAFCGICGMSTNKIITPNNNIVQEEEILIDEFPNMLLNEAIAKVKKRYKVEKYRYAFVFLILATTFFLPATIFLDVVSYTTSWYGYTYEHTSSLMSIMSSYYSDTISNIYIYDSLFVWCIYIISLSIMSTKQKPKISYIMSEICEFVFFGIVILNFSLFMRVYIDYAQGEYAILSSMYIIMGGHCFALIMCILLHLYKFIKNIKNKKTKEVKKDEV